MKLIVVGSGSSGNCYILTNGKETLIIECGLPFMEVKKKLHFDIRNIVGVVCSHEHADHYKYASEYRLAGKKLFTPFIEEQRASKVVYEGFSIQAFPLVHSVPCYGFLITHKEMGKLLFITDTEYVPQNFKKVKINHLLLEMNYDKEIMTDRDNARKYAHVLTGHMEKETTLKFLRNCVNRESLQTIILCHLSRSNSDPKAFKQAAEEVTGLPVFIAETDLEIELTQEGL